MSSTAVYNALKGFIQPDDTIDLWAAANGSADLAGMIPVLGLFNIAAKYTLTQVVLTQTPSGASVVLTGKGLFVGGVSYPVNATLRYLQDGNIFSFTLDVIPDWVFSDFFPELPPTLMIVPTVSLGVAWYPSVLTGMKVRSVVLA